MEGNEKSERGSKETWITQSGTDLKYLGEVGAVYFLISFLLYSLIFSTVGSPGLSLMFCSFSGTKMIQNTEKCPLGFSAVALYPRTFQKKYSRIHKCELLNL
jgi:hypothetical protein